MVVVDVDVNVDGDDDVDLDDPTLTMNSAVRRQLQRGAAERVAC
jgi:hypothetical protein